MLYIKKLYNDSKIPVKQNKTDSGYDLFAHSVKQIYTHSGSNGERQFTDDISMRFDGKQLRLNYLERALIGTGISATVDVGYELQIRPRSGLSLKQGLSVVNSPGTIDYEYRKEIGIILINYSRMTQSINLGERIAQMVICPVKLDEIEVVNELPNIVGKNKDTDNKRGGFGSTGTK